MPATISSDPRLSPRGPADSARSAPAKTHAAVDRFEIELAAPVADGAADVPPAHTPRNQHREVGRDFAIHRRRAHVGAEVGREIERDAAVHGVKDESFAPPGGSEAAPDRA